MQFFRTQSPGDGSLSNIFLHYLCHDLFSFDNLGAIATHLFAETFSAVPRQNPYTQLKIQSSQIDRNRNSERIAFRVATMSPTIL
jgi:hypothetical protein